MDTIEAPENELMQSDAIIPRKPDSMPVVGLGASAGGIQALSEFFAQMPADSGMAFVVILHLSPDHESLLSQLLQRSTQMAVVQVTKAVKVLPDHVYVIPQGHNLEMTDGHIRLTERQKEQGSRVAIDLFFRSLAEMHGSRATAIILSGADGDGAMGLKRVKEQGGLTIAQEPDEAEYDSMPRAAIATGMVDWVLPVAQMPQRVVAYFQNENKIRLAAEDEAEDAPPSPEGQKRGGEFDEAALREVLSVLRVRTGHDFNAYKRATVLRRVARRLQINGLETLSAYLEFLRSEPDETSALLQDLLISVTNFFRDREAFAALEDLIPQLFKGKTTGDQVRVWVCACATGEEAYSVAMLLCEHAAKLDAPPAIQVFATDLDNTAIRAAREGLYHASISSDVSEERLRRFFSHEHGWYRVRSEIREIVLFAAHNALKDPSFSRLDLIACRNLLIYLGQEAKLRLLNIFHFALRPNGYLFLGGSESADDATLLFKTFSKKHRLYTPRSLARTGLPLPALTPQLPALTAPPPARHEPVMPPLEVAVPTEMARGVNFWGALHLQMLEEYAPPSLLVNEEQEIVHMSEHVGRFLYFAGGEPSSNLLRVVHPALRLELRTALFRAAQENKVIQARHLPLELDGEARFVHFSVRPVQQPEAVKGGFLVVFEEEERKPESQTDSAPPPSDSLARDLEAELLQVKTNLRATVEQYEVSSEELKASNEELQATNEELRMVAEEMETGKEELQSLNEELISVNEEMKFKIEEVTRQSNYLNNLINSTDIGTIFLDRDFRVNLFTPAAREIFSLISTDLGRPLTDISNRLEDADLLADAAAVLETLQTIEREVRLVGGRVFMLRVLPYRTTEDKINGVVLTFFDITERKKADEARSFLAAIVESSEDSIFTINFGRTITSWNHAAEQLYGYRADEVLGKSLTMLTLPEDLKQVLKNVDKVRDSQTVEVFDTIRIHKDGREINLEMVLSPVKDAAGQIIGVSTIARDVTERREQE